MKRLLIIDHHALLHRSRNAMLRTGREFTTSDGTPVTGVFTYINALLSTIKDVEPSHVVVCYDAGGNTRKSEDSDYKANRTKVSDSFHIENRILLDEALYSMGIEAVGHRGYEADDCIFTIAHQASFGGRRFDEVVILTCDQDILACASDTVKVLLFNSAKQKEMMDREAVKAKWDCWPDQIRFVKALSGDASDNIAGIPRIGKKTAVKILEECNYIEENVLAHPKVKEFTDLVTKNLDLVNLRHVWGLGAIPFDDYEVGKGIGECYEEFLAKYEFSQLQKRANTTKKLLRMTSQ